MTSNRRPGRPRTGNAAYTMNMNPAVHGKLKEWTASSGLTSSMGDAVRVLVDGAEARLQRLVDDGAVGPSIFGSPLIAVDLLRKVDEGTITFEEFCARAQGYGAISASEQARATMPKSIEPDPVNEMTADEYRAWSLKRQEELEAELRAQGEWVDE